MKLQIKDGHQSNDIRRVSSDSERRPQPQRSKKEGGFSHRVQVKAPILATQNRFDGLSVDIMTDCDLDTVVVSCNNGRGSQTSELGAPEACLIPVSNKLITKESKEGVKDEKVFI